MRPFFLCIFLLCLRYTNPQRCLSSYKQDSAGSGLSPSLSYVGSQLQNLGPNPVGQTGWILLPRVHLWEEAADAGLFGIQGLGGLSLL
jgi:hypothetical protein